ncbi:hypothetical protein BKA69DRAFT_1025496 [Paraphysoderma sedebokerense]|nr:hypothetical protein BKA69DRAFT_1025496 [Paraphysoderma sedebokerense]
MPSSAPPTLNIAFVHPDLGIGGAERLIVDAAVGLQNRGHKVTVFTSHHDTTHCFVETRDGGTLSVATYGDFLPTTIFNYFHIFFAIIRNYYLCFVILWNTLLGRWKYDLIIVDQISAGLPVLRLTGAKILFYCHFPDKLLTRRTNILKRIYRFGFDWFEEITTGMADDIVLNSLFTRSVFQSSFKRIKKLPKVVYPGINVNAYSNNVDLNDTNVKPLKDMGQGRIILSINRFERKKNIDLAIHAFAQIRDDKIIPKKQFEKLKLVIAGGYDTRVPENVEYHQELEALAKSYNLATFSYFRHSPSSASSSAVGSAIPTTTQVVFLPSFSEPQRTYLLAVASVLIYTPKHEHFGIVPVEAMYAGVPVVALNSGGPKESVKNGVTGWLVDCNDDGYGVARALGEAVKMNERERKAISKRGREWVESKFTLEKFVESLESVIAGFW